MSHYEKLDISIKTERFIIRTLVKKDATITYQNWLNDSDTKEYIEYARNEHNLKDLEEYINSKYLSPNTLFLGIFYNNQHIGNIKYEPINEKLRTAVMGIMIGEKSWRGKGVAGEVINGTALYLYKTHGISSIELGVHKEHTSAIRAYEKLGFKISSPQTFEVKDYSLGMTLEIKD